MDQTCLANSGGFAPISFPLFPGCLIRSSMVAFGSGADIGSGSGRIRAGATCTATFGIGWRTVGTTNTMRRQRTDRLGLRAIAIFASSAAVPGPTSQRCSGQPAAARAVMSAALSTLAFGSRGHSRALPRLAERSGLPRNGGTGERETRKIKFNYLHCVRSEPPAPVAAYS